MNSGVMVKKNISKQRINLQYPSTNRYQALNFARENKLVDKSEIKSIRKYIKSQVGYFSIFRTGALEYSMVTRLALSDNYQVEFDNLNASYNLLKKYKFDRSSELMLVAYGISLETNDLENDTKKIKYIYRGLNKPNKLIYKNINVKYLGELIKCDLSEDVIILRVNETVKVLKPTFKKKVLCFDLAKLIVSNNYDEQQISEIINLYEELKNNKIKYLDDATLIIQLYKLDMDAREIKNLVVDKLDYFKNIRYFNWLYLLPENRYRFAIIEVLKDNNVNDENLYHNVVNDIIVKETSFLTICAFIGVFAGYTMY